MLVFHIYLHVSCEGGDLYSFTPWMDIDSKLHPSIHCNIILYKIIN